MKLLPRTNSAQNSITCIVVKCGVRKQLRLTVVYLQDFLYIQLLERGQALGLLPCLSVPMMGIHPPNPPQLGLLHSHL